VTEVSSARALLRESGAFHSFGMFRCSRRMARSRRLNSVTLPRPSDATSASSTRSRAASIPPNLRALSHPVCGELLILAGRDDGVETYNWQQPLNRPIAQANQSSLQEIDRFNGALC